jgi:hypothetical protein
MIQQLKDSLMCPSIQPQSLPSPFTQLIQPKEEEEKMEVEEKPPMRHSERKPKVKVEEFKEELSTEQKRVMRKPKPKQSKKEDVSPKMKTEESEHVPEL